jgi:3-hydroxymyristoyl/3-hydroxydecanoyl-(acyl carrier protein) dehydratase
MINPKDVLDEGFRFSDTPSDGAGAMRGVWSVPADLPYFAGHFPGQPTLPAVAILDLTLELIRRWPGFEKAELGGVESAKFSAVVEPGADVAVSLTRSGSEWRAEWKLDGACGGVAAANLRLRVRV